jgi:uncharacterized Zn finger protein
MPTTACPVCRAPAPRLLSVLSELSAAVNYYRCESCGHVWTVTKDGTRIVTTVTISHHPADPDSKD